MSRLLPNFSGLVYRSYLDISIPSLQRGKKIPSLALENLLVDAIAYYFRKMEQLNVVTPIYVMISLLRVGGYKMVLLQLFKINPSCRCFVAK